jgi:hypothetical protein
MRRALAPLLFADEELEHDRRHRDPVAKATPSLSAKAKKLERRTEDGLPIQDFHSLLRAMATRTRNTCRVTTDESVPPVTFTQLTEPTPLQVRAFQLLGLYPVAANP